MKALNPVDGLMNLGEGVAFTNREARSMKHMRCLHYVDFGEPYRHTEVRGTVVDSHQNDSGFALLYVFWEWETWDGVKHEHHSIDGLLSKESAEKLNWWFPGDLDKYLEAQGPSAVAHTGTA